MLKSIELLTSANKIAHNDKRAGEAGYTFIETLIFISVAALITGAILSFFFISFDAGRKIERVQKTSLRLLYIDRVIREKAEKFTIPYWARGEVAAKNFADQLLQSSIGKEIKSVKMLFNREKQAAGVEVTYAVPPPDNGLISDNVVYKTAALFSGKAVVGEW